MSSAFEHLRSAGLALTKRTAERRVQGLGLLPPALGESGLTDEFGRPPNSLLLGWALRRMRAKRQHVFFCQLQNLPNGRPCLHANDARGTRVWMPMNREADGELIARQLRSLQQHVQGAIAIVPSGELVRWLRTQPEPAFIEWVTGAFLPTIAVENKASRTITSDPVLTRLESETIYLIREAVALSAAPVFRFTGSKTSSVLLHLLRKAFSPSPLPVRLLGPDPERVFPEVAAMCNQLGIGREAAGTACRPASDMHLLADPDPSALIQACTDGPSCSPFSSPLSRWTNLDLWRYIEQEGLAVLPLYFAEPRPVVRRAGMLFLINHPEFQLQEHDKIVEKTVRIEALSPSALQGCIESNVSNVPEIVLELMQTPFSSYTRRPKQDRQRAAGAGQGA